jgi:hypothetical protein
MTVLVDTSVWSLALRRQARQLTVQQKHLCDELAELIREARARLIGPVRQELLSGIRSEAQYERLRRALRAFEDPALAVEDYEEAARVTNLCRARGVAGSPTDFLICAVALQRQWPIFTTDDDFRRYARLLPLQLHEPRSRAQSHP